MGKLATSQSAWGHDKFGLIEIQLPHPDQELLPGIEWGFVEEILSPAFWKYQTQMQRNQKRFIQHKLGQTLKEEVAVCLLGGFGMPAELGIVAFQRLKKKRLLDGEATAEAIETQLSELFIINGKARKYRFPRQKAKYLAKALKGLDEGKTPDQPVALRNYLTTFSGIGPKTASWVVRNHLNTDKVAILDVHIIRAGVNMGLYDPSNNPTKSYYPMEEKFLAFCAAINEPASSVDAVMWDMMRRLGRLAIPKVQPVTA